MSGAEGTLAPLIAGAALGAQVATVLLVPAAFATSAVAVIRGGVRFADWTAVLAPAAAAAVLMSWALGEADSAATGAAAGACAAVAWWAALRGARTVRSEGRRRPRPNRKDRRWWTA